MESSVPTLKAGKMVTSALYNAEHVQYQVSVACLGGADLFCHHACEACCSYSFSGQNKSIFIQNPNYSGTTAA